MARRDVERDAAQGLRRLLDAIEAGEVDVETPAERRMVALLEGAAIGLEALERPR